MGYSKAEEQSIRMQASVQEWARSGLLDAGQAAKLAEEVRPSLQCTNIFLRAVLFVFTGLVVFALVLLVLFRIDVRDSHAVAAIYGIAAIASFSLAEFVIARFRVYRFGVEEALAAASVVLAVCTTVQIESHSDFSSNVALALAVAAAGSLVVYIRFGFVYAGIAAIACAATIPFPIVHSEVMSRVAAAAVLAAMFWLTGMRYRVYGDEYPGEDYAAFQSVAWVGLYVVANLKMTSAGINSGWFYWTTYVLIWLLPAAGLWIGIRGKDRFLMDTSIAMALATLATNKTYLGLQHQTWDPMLLGILLVGLAVIVRRWLAGGLKGERYGFTPVRILNKDAQLMTVVGTASAVLHPGLAAHEPPAAQQPRFDGGRSGGAGATGQF